MTVRANPTRAAPTLSDEEAAAFHRDGFVGPFPRFAPVERLDAVATRLADIVEAKRSHPLYGRHSVRDFHLIDDDVRALFTHAAIVERLVPLLGADLVLWRTKIFHKAPGEGPLGWHQEWGAFNGEEIGNDVPGLRPSDAGSQSSWNLTVWIALDDITEFMGPLRFARGTHRRRFPVEMAPMAESEFWHDPLLGVDDVRVLVDRARNCSLVLDVDTSGVFDGIDPATLDLAAARRRLLDALSDQVGAVTCDFDSGREDIVALPMRKGDFVIFTERCMHGSGANLTDNRRLAINGRVTRADTIVYPGRLAGDFTDGSNLDISPHWCVLLSGEDRSAGLNHFCPEIGP
jgi:non-heme Fe2+,alpha-ketoglutarate-dependent halogenase